MTWQTDNYSTMKLKTKESAVIASVYGENITVNLKEWTKGK